MLHLDFMKILCWRFSFYSYLADKGKEASLPEVTVPEGQGQCWKWQMLPAGLKSLVSDLGLD
jgi:hypothetical protein